MLLPAHLERRGQGDVGPALCVQREAGEEWHTHRRLGTRSLKTVFATVQVVRMGHSRTGAPSIYPLAQTLVLPARSFSWELQRRPIEAAVQNPFHASVATIADLTGVAVSKRSLEEMLRDAARDFDAFYRQRSPETAAGAILLAVVDGKGMPMVKPSGVPQPSARRAKGRKANRKRMATVATVFTRAPRVRTPEQVVESLFPTRRPSAADSPAPPRAENKRVWASPLKGKTTVIQEVAPEIQRRDPGVAKTRVARSDGERALQILLERRLGVASILDLPHVLEKPWKAAYVFHAEGSLEAELRGRDRTLRVLSGQSGQVVQGLRPSVTERGLHGANRNTPQRAADYIYRNRARMHDDEYLANGWPIARGSVEGACKNPIMDRMERSGMRWSEEMAEAIVQLRAISLSGDLDAYWSFHMQEEQHRLYPHRWTVVLK